MTGPSEVAAALLWAAALIVAASLAAPPFFKGALIYALATMSLRTRVDTRLNRSHTP